MSGKVDNIHHLLVWTNMRLEGKLSLRMVCTKLEKWANINI